MEALRWKGSILKHPKWKESLSAMAAHRSNCKYWPTKCCDQHGFAQHYLPFYPWCLTWGNSFISGAAKGIGLAIPTTMPSWKNSKIQVTIHISGVQSCARWRSSSSSIAYQVEGDKDTNKQVFIVKLKAFRTMKSKNCNRHILFFELSGHATWVVCFFYKFVN